MPEGPETKNLVEWLNKDLKNKVLNSIKIHGGRYKRHSQPKNFNKIIFPLTVENINCRGKFIYWTFKNSDMVLFNTLGMSGWYQYDDEKHNNNWSRICWDFPGYSFIPKSLCFIN